VCCGYCAHVEHQRHYARAFGAGKFPLLWDCYGRFNSLIRRKIPLFRQVTNLRCNHLISCAFLRRDPGHWTLKTRFTLHLVI